MFLLGPWSLWSLDVLAKGLHWSKGCVTFLARKGESPVLFCFFFGLFFKIKKQGLSSGVVHEDALSSYTPKMPCFSLISDFSWSQVGEQSYLCSCPGEKKKIWAGVKYSPSFYSGISEVVPSHSAFFNHWFWSTSLCQRRKEPKYLGQWETKNLRWFWVVWWVFSRTGAKGIILHLAPLPVNRWFGFVELREVLISSSQLFHRF